MRLIFLLLASLLLTACDGPGMLSARHAADTKPPEDIQKKCPRATAEDYQAARSVCEQSVKTRSEEYKFKAMRYCILKNPMRTEAECATIVSRLSEFMDIKSYCRNHTEQECKVQAQNILKFVTDMGSIYKDDDILGTLGFCIQEHLGPLCIPKLNER